MPKSPAQRIRDGRAKLALTQEEFGRLLGRVGPHIRRTVSRWESGERDPDPAVLLLMDRLIAERD